MQRPFFLIVAAIVALAPGSSRAQSGGGVGPSAGLLLLKNGELLAGDITRSGDYYLVAASDSELQIRLHDVDAVCRDLDEAYRCKSAKINRFNAEDHALLAGWCIDHKLFGHAARELTEAYKLDDTHPRIVILERRLKAEMSKPKSAAVAAAPPSLPGPTDEQLEQTARSISPEALQEFTVRVQPLLVNYCATAGCHGPKPGSKFQLHRVYLNERNDPRQVRMNLHAVMTQLDRKRVGSSPLLTVPLGTHGGGKKPLFTAYNSEHYRMLAAWAARVSANGGATPATADASTTTVPAPTGALLQRLPMAPPGGEAPLAAPTPMTPAASSPTTIAPADPFDPAEFNRRQVATPAVTSPSSIPAEPTVP